MEDGKTVVTDCRPKWAPSIHRSLTGKKSDHALLECKWKWRIRLMKSEPVKDFSALQPNVDDQGNKTASVHHGHHVFVCPYVSFVGMSLVQTFCVI